MSLISGALEARLILGALEARLGSGAGMTSGPASAGRVKTPGGGAVVMSELKLRPPKEPGGGVGPGYTGGGSGPKAHCGAVLRIRTLLPG
jgi:hypothetical protein